MGRRIKELETRLLGMNTLKERLEEMEERLTEMEEMTETVVCLPGMTVIPRIVESFISMASGAGVLCNIWISGIQLPQGHNRAHFNHFKITSESQFISESTPTSVRNLAYLTGCTNITICPQSPVKVKDIECIGELPDIREINLVNIENLMDLSWITGCQQLTHLVLFGCSNLHDITPLRELKNLTVLDIRGTNVKNTAFLTNSRLTITK